jgi:hypothetical protein
MTVGWQTSGCLAASLSASPVDLRRSRLAVTPAAGMDPSAWDPLASDPAGTFLTAVSDATIVRGIAIGIATGAAAMGRRASDDPFVWRLAASAARPIASASCPHASSSSFTLDSETLSERGLSAAGSRVKPRDSERDWTVSPARVGGREWHSERIGPPKLGTCSCVGSLFKMS